MDYEDVNRKRAPSLEEDDLTAGLKAFGIIVGEPVPGTYVPADPWQDALSEIVMPISLSSASTLL